MFIPKAENAAFYPVRGAVFERCGRFYGSIHAGDASRAGAVAHLRHGFLVAFYERYQTALHREVNHIVIATSMAPNANKRASFHRA